MRLQKYYFFHIRQKIFLIFFASYPQSVDFLKSKFNIFFLTLLDMPWQKMFFGYL